MEYRKSGIQELRKALDEGKVTSEELFETAKKLAKASQEVYNPFVTILEKFKQKRKAESILTGIPYALKDNLSTSNILTTASSNILKNYIPVYDATVYKKLKESGAVLVGKTVLDELAMGGTGTTGNTGIVRNPWDPQREIGGSSAGSACAVALGIVPFSLASDTGDSIRKPAAFGGIVGYKPTYGLLSRYGLFAFASSLDHVGCFTRSVEDAAIVTNLIKGKDPHDMTTFNSEKMDLISHLKEDIQGRKLFYIKEIVEEEYEDETSKAILENFFETIEIIKKAGFIVEGVSIDKYLLEAIYPTYMAISCAEATSNNANLTGIQFGVRGEGKTVDEIMFSARTKGFSELIKRRFVLGSYILQKENQEKLYLNACRIRRLLVERLTELFQKYDGLLLPCSGGIAPTFDEATDQLSDRYLLLENHMALGNFGGFPSITLPCGLIKGCPIGINLTSAVKADELLLNMAYKIEEQLPYKGQIGGDLDV